MKIAARPERFFAIAIFIAIMATLFAYPSLSPSSTTTIIQQTPVPRSLWVGEEGTVVAVSLADGQPGLYIQTQFLQDIAVDNSRSFVWVGTQDEIIQYRFDGSESFRHPIRQNTLVLTNQDTAGPVRISLDPSDGSLWIGAGQEVIKLSSDDRELYRIPGFDDITDVSVDSADGSCWVAEKRKISKYASDGTALFSVNIDEYIFITALAADPVSHDLWVGTEQGLGKTDAQGQELFRTEEPVGIKDMEVNSATGSLWLVTKNEVYKYSKDNQKLLTIPLCPATQQTATIAFKSVETNTTPAAVSENTTQNTTCGTEFISIAVDTIDNTVWVATKNTLFKGSDAGALFFQVPGFINIQALDIGLPTTLSITITEPQEGAIVETPAIAVKGTITGSPSMVTVNGLQASLAGNLFEVHAVPLAAGLNTITATAVNAAGFTTTDTVQVTYTPPIPPLPPLTIKINSPQQGATFTTPRITVTGTMSDPAAMVLVNGMPAVVTGNTFTAADVQLAIGANTITAVAVDPLARTASDSIEVTYTWLAISITYPADGDVTDQSVTDVEGTISDPTAYVVVNGKEAEVAPEGTFIAFRVRLSPGPNQITAQATNREGQTDTAEVQVTYQPSSEPLELSILSPTDGAVIETPMVTVKGVINDPTAFVVVNDTPARVEDTIFTANVSVCERGPEVPESHPCSIRVTAYTDDGRRALGVTDYFYFPSQDPLTVRITNPAPGRTVASPLVTITGEIHDALAHITPTVVTINGVAAEVQGNTFTAPLELTDGKNYFTVRAVNMLGRDAFDSLCIIYESPSTPLQVMIARPINGSIVNYPVLSVSGSVSDSTATVAVNGTAVALDFRAFHMPSLPLTVGENTITVTAERRDSDPAEESVHVTYDPAYLSPPAPLLGELPMYSSSGGVEVSGLAAPGYRIEMLVNGVPGFFLINPDANGLFKTSVGLPLEGPNHISARTVDAFGNKSVPSNEAIVIRDTLKPSIHNVVNYMHSLGLAVSRVQLMGETEPGAKVELTIDGDPEYKYQTTAEEQGGFFILTNLSAGRHYVDILATDKVGNKAGYSKPFFVHTPLSVFALTDPCPPTDPSCIANGSGEVSTNSPIPPMMDPIPSPINETSITVEGNAYAYAAVEVYRNNERVGTVRADARGRFSLAQVGLAPGVNIIKARQLELQVDIGTRYRMLKAADSKKVTVEVTSGPAVRPDIHIAFPLNGSVTNGELLPLRGAVSSSVTSVRMNGGYYSDSNYSHITDNTFIGNGPIPLLPGKNVLWAEASAADGSRGVDKIIVYSRKDALVPSVTITSPVDGQTVYEQSIPVAGITGDTVQKVIVNETESVLNNGAFTSAVNISGGYGNGAIAWAMDQAGAIGHHEVGVLYQYVIPPTITITSPGDGQVVSTPTVTVTGTVSHAFEVLINSRTATMNGNAFSILLDLVQGQNTINVIAKNNQRASVKTITVSYLPDSLALESLALYPAAQSLPVGRTLQFTALGTYSNGQIIDLTLACAWASSNSSNAAVNNGLARAIAVGETIITASRGAISASLPLTVSTPALDSVSVVHELGKGGAGAFYAFDNPTVTAGQAISFKAFGLYNGGYVDVTNGTTWTSSNPATAAIDAAGRATAIIAGATQITASVRSESGQTITGSSILTVTPPSMNVFITQPSEGNALDTSEITVTGSVFTTAREVGITVNGVPATVYGNQYTARISLSEGSNEIKASAVDSNGATATARITVIRSQTTNPVTLTANIESGIAPFETTLRVDGYASNTTPNITYIGPGAVEFIDCSSYDACRVRMTTEGIYTFTATAIGADGNTHNATVKVTVLNRADLDTLLKAKWEEMKGALASQNVEGAVGYFSTGSKDTYRQHFARLAQDLPRMVADMGALRLVKVTEWLAEYDLRTIRNGEEYSFQVLFMKDQDGTWRIRSF